MERQTFGHRRTKGGPVGGMGNHDVRERPSRTHRPAGPAFDLVVSKLRRPPVRPGAVRRSPLIERLTRGDPGPIVSSRSQAVTRSRELGLLAA